MGQRSRLTRARVALGCGLTLGAALLTAGTSLGVGGIVSGGGDNIMASTGSMWFQRPGVISYCIQLAPTFGASRDVAKAAIEAAFQTWKDYFNAKLPGATYVWTTDAGPSDVALLNNTLSLADGACTGREDLSFFLGINTPDSDDAKKHFENPTAFTTLMRYDLAKFWGQGFVWVASAGQVDPKTAFPDWSNPLHLQGILLHEFGHILGVGHVTGTIMAENISTLLRPSPDLNETVRLHDLTHVDHAKELVLCDSCAFKRTSNFAGLAMGELFGRLAGRAPLGGVYVDFEQWSATDQRNSASGAAGYGGVKGQITLRDDLGSVPLDFVYDPDSDEAYEGSAEIFRWLNKVPGHGSAPPVVVARFHADGGSSHYGTLFTAAGAAFPIIVSRNMTVKAASCHPGDAVGDRWLSVFVLSDHGKERLY